MTAPPSPSGRKTPLWMAACRVVTFDGIVRKRHRFDAEGRCEHCKRSRDELARYAAWRPSGTPLSRSKNRKSGP